jgi:hypothetical protein
MESINPLWYCLPPTATVLRQTRFQHPEGGDVRAGLNYMIILTSTSYLEAVFERGLSEIVHTLPKADHPTDRGLRLDLLSRIGCASGANEYRKLFQLTTGVALQDLRLVKPHWESLDALFTLRNMLAHGRAITAKVVFPKDEHAQSETEYREGYRKVSKYLAKLGVVAPDNNPLSMDWFCLRDAVADHFWNLAFRTVMYVGESLGGNAAAAFKSSVYLPAHAIEGAQIDPAASSG